jgi:hypothetical protein
MTRSDNPQRISAIVRRYLFGDADTDRAFKGTVTASLANL